MALLAAGVAFVAYDRYRAQEQLAAVAAERDKARAVAHFFEELFSSASPNEVREGKLTARELLQRSVARLAQGDTATMPDDARGAMYAAAAKVMQRQQLLDEAATLYERAIALWRSLPRLPLEDLTTSLNDRADTAYRQGQLGAALDWQRQALAVRDGMGDKTSTNRGHLLQMLAVYQRMSGQREDAVRSLEEAAAILRTHLPESRPYYAVVLGNLASFALYDGHAEQGLAHAREGLAQILQLKPERTQTVLNLQRMEAAALRELGRLDEALAQYDRVVERTRREFDPNDNLLAEGLYAQAQVLMLLQRWDEADSALREAEAIQTRNGGERHQRALTARADRARVLMARERWQEAIAVLEAVQALRPADSGSERSSAAAEAVELAYAHCRRSAAPGSTEVDAMEAAMQGLRRDPPLPRVRLAQAEDWLKDCRQRAAAP